MPSRALLAVLASFAVGSDIRAAETGFYIGADMAGVAPTVHKSDGTNFITRDGVTHVDPESVHYDDSALGWSALIGYRVHRNLAAEFAYTDFGSIDVQEVYELPDLVPGIPGSRRMIQESSKSVSGPMLSVLGILPVSAGLEAYGRAGVLWASQEVELTPNFSIFNDAEAQWVLGIGMQVELGRAWSARLEYQRIDEMPGTFMSGAVDYERVLAGATYRLGSREVWATDREPLAAGTQDGFYAVVDVGVSEPTVGKSDGFAIAIVPPGVIFTISPRSVSASGSVPGFGASLGYRINRYLAAELSYTDFGSVDIAEEYLIELPFPFPPSEPRREVIDLAARVTGPSVNVLGILPVGDDFELFLRGGLLFADQDVTRRSSGFTNASASAAELWVIGGGVDVRLADRWSVRVGYESVDRLRKGISVGPMRLERFAFGVSYDF